jgi:hypothetical protein
MKCTGCNPLSVCWNKPEDNHSLKLASQRSITLPEKENDGTERVIKPVIDNEHVVVLERLQEETNKDEQLLKLKECINQHPACP